MSTVEHWNHVYQSKKPEEVSWYAPHLDRSLELIMAAAPDKSARIIDVGAGESTLVDDLLHQQYRNVSLLDISEAALSATKTRLGALAGEVSWHVGDITDIALPIRYFDVWHDRAVFHFLTEPEARLAYIEQVKGSVKPGGHIIVATFGPQGPRMCSGLNVVRYDPARLHQQFGEDVDLLRHTEENHHTPWGSVQQFIYCYCRLS